MALEYPSNHVNSTYSQYDIVPLNATVALREWMQANEARADEFCPHAHYIEPTPTKAALGHSMHTGKTCSSASQAAHAAAVQSFKLSKFTKTAKHKVDDTEPAVMDTIRPVRDVRINGQTQAALCI